MRFKPGDRVGAILGKNDDGSVDFFGYGVYEGRFPPAEAVGFLAEAAREVPGYVNPRIRLDSGKMVYGCECWWGAEEKVKKALSGAKINLVDIDEIRIKSMEDENG